MKGQKDPGMETIGFRCPPEERALFLRNVASRGWTKDTVLRALVHGFNELYAQSGGKPEWPLSVKDAYSVAADMTTEERADYKKRNPDQTKRIDALQPGAPLPTISSAVEKQSRRPSPSRKSRSA
jgi:hypothetical protein